MALGLNWAKHSRLKRADGKEEPYMGEKKEFLVRFAKQYMQRHKDIDYFMFGHRHIELDLMLSKKTRLMILGDWIWQFTYAVFDGEHMFMEEYVEGESQTITIKGSYELPFILIAGFFLPKKSYY